MVTLRENKRRKEDDDERVKTGTAGADNSRWCMGGKPPGKEREQIGERICKRSGGRRAGERVSGASRAGWALVYCVLPPVVIK